MAVVPKNSQSIFPDYPRDTPTVDKDGTFNAVVDLGFGSLFQALQDNFKNEGIMIPSLSAVDMAAIQSLYAGYIDGTYEALALAIKDISGQTVFDKDTYITNQFVIAVDTNGIVLLAEWVPLAMQLTSVGDPNVATAGVINWLCLDTTGPTLYACTVTGNPGTWVSV